MNPNRERRFCGRCARALSSLLKNGDWFRAAAIILEELRGCEVPVALFQQAASATAHLHGLQDVYSTVVPRPRPARRDGEEDGSARPTPGLARRPHPPRAD